MIPSRAMRRMLRIALLVLPVALMLLWSVWTERVQYRVAAATVSASGRHAAAGFASVLADRLDTQFTALQFAALALLGPHADAVHPDAAVVRALRRFMALHPSLYAFNIQSADGQAIVWSTRPQATRPITRAQGFTTLPGRPDFLLGRQRFAGRVEAHVLTMRYRVRGPDGSTRYLVGTPYRVDDLLRGAGAASMRMPWSFDVRDERDGSLLGSLRHGQVRFATGASQPVRVSVAVPGFPLLVQGAWSGTLVRALYLRGAWLRWLFEAASIVLLALAAWLIGGLLERRARDGARLLRLARFSALRAEIVQAAQRCGSEPEFLDAVCRAGVDAARLPLLWVGRPDASQRSFEVLASAGATEYLRKVPISPDAALPGGRGPTGKAWRDAVAVFVQRHRGPQVGEPWAGEGARHGLGAFAAVPLHEQERMSAVLTLYCRDVAVWDAESRGIVVDLAAHIEQGLDALRQRRRVSQLERLYQALAQAADLLLGARDEPGMLRGTCEQLVRGTPFHAAWIGRPDDAGIFRVLAQAGRGADALPEVPASLQQGRGGPLIVRAWRSQRMAYNNDHLADPEMAPWRDFLQRHAWRAALAAPVFRGARLWAVLVFVSPSPRIFDSKTLALCERISELLGHGLDELDRRRQLAELQRRTAHRARHDTLTQLPNRFGLEQAVPQAIAGARRRRSRLAVGLIDLDRFKQVNDTYGHAVGDALLRQFAARLRACLRESDFLARLGGDEFVVVLEDLAQAASTPPLGSLLERLRGAVDRPFDVGVGRPVEVDMTMGVAMWPRDGDDLDALLRKADAAMYRAKSAPGRRSGWWFGDGVAPANAAAQTVAESSARDGTPGH